MGTFDKAARGLVAAAADHPTPPVPAAEDDAVDPWRVAHERDTAIWAAAHRDLLAERDALRQQVADLRALNDNRLAEIDNLKRIIREERVARGADPYTGEPALAEPGGQVGEGRCEVCGHPDDGNCNCPLLYSPAPVVPDSAASKPESAEHESRTSSQVTGASNPDSPDALREAVSKAEAALSRATHGDDPTTWAGTPWWHVHRLLRALAALPTPASVTTERAWDEGYAAGVADVYGADYRNAAVRPNPYARAVVRPTVSTSDLTGMECHEGMGDGPCDATAVALRLDPEAGEPYPVCADHVRADMVPLCDLLAVVGQGVTAEVHQPGENAEDCPACAGTNPPYPFLCPGDDRYRPAPSTTTERTDR